MAGEDNKAVARRVCQEVWSEGRLDAADELLAADCKGHTPEHREFTGPAGLKEAVTELREAFPDLNIEVTLQVAEDDRVVTEFQMKGVHTNTYLGTRPTKKPIDVASAVMTRHADGKITEYWAEWDRRQLLEQVGVVPTLNPQGKPA
jgi:steroid delta-isomerase-like uncharacterized protein